MPTAPHIADKIAGLKALPPSDEADDNDPLIILLDLKSPTRLKHRTIYKRVASYEDSKDFNRDVRLDPYALIRWEKQGLSNGDEWVFKYIGKRSVSRIIGYQRRSELWHGEWN
ncbi:uncharacterized protein LOC110936933 [Helianthus annuus]|uniref:uncharacterized protein LOC110936933 n=1 Tax=Helianthus annuus TaxID=4232 RepID=UPI000B8FD30E|nr:uncharacterized protein LOC110936933 [Helianthus annuus]